MEISKRQVVRILTNGLEDFVAEDQAVLRTGLASAPYVSVDDTGAHHACRDGITTQIGGARFTVLRTGRSKSRLNFLSLLQAGNGRQVRDVIARADEDLPQAPHPLPSETRQSSARLNLVARKSAPLTRDSQN